MFNIWILTETNPSHLQ